MAYSLFNLRKLFHASCRLTSPQKCDFLILLGQFTFMTKSLPKLSRLRHANTLCGSAFCGDNFRVQCFRGLSAEGFWGLGRISLQFWCILMLLAMFQSWSFQQGHHVDGPAKSTSSPGVQTWSMSFEAVEAAKIRPHCLANDLVTPITLILLNGEIV